MSKFLLVFCLARVVFNVWPVLLMNLRNVGTNVIGTSQFIRSADSALRSVRCRFADPISLIKVDTIFFGAKMN